MGASFWIGGHRSSVPRKRSRVTCLPGQLITVFVRHVNVSEHSGVPPGRPCRHGISATAHGLRLYTQQLELGSEYFEVRGMIINHQYSRSARGKTCRRFA